MRKTQSKTKFQSTFWKREQGILKDPERCLNDEGPQLNDNVADNFKESENVTVMRDSKFRPCGLYVTGFIGQYKLVWLVDTGAMKNILSYECYKRLPEDLQFPLHQGGSQVLVADGRRANTYGRGNLTVRVGRQDANISVLVTDIEDWEFLSAVDAKIDLVEQQLVINGEEIDCCNQNCQQISFRCVTRRLVTIQPHSEKVIPVHLLHRQSSPGTATQGLRILEPCGTRLQEKGLYIGRTLVSAGGTSLVTVRILNTSDQTQTLGAQTVVAVAKAVTSVAELELPQVASESTTSEVHRNHPEEEYKETLPGPLKELWERSEEQLTEEESHAVAKLLHRHKDIFSLSEQEHKDKSRHNQEVKQPVVVPCSVGDEEGWLSKILCRL